MFVCLKVGTTVGFGTVLLVARRNARAGAPTAAAAGPTAVAAQAAGSGLPLEQFAEVQGVNPSFARSPKPPRALSGSGVELVPQL